MNKYTRFCINTAKNVKNKKDLFLRPLVLILTSMGIAPLFITVLSLFAGISGAVMLQYSKNIFLVLILLHVFFDLLDGALARHQKRHSIKGAWTDWIFDRIIMLSVIASLYFLTKNPLAFALLIAYTLSTIIYSVVRGRIYVLYYEPIFYLIIYFNISLAVFLELILTTINTLVILFYLALIITLNKKS